MGWSMTERLHNLLLRQSEAGEPAILWGRLAKPFLGKEFDRLLHCGVLIEEAPADDWDVCSDCECGHDSRRIQLIDGRLIAACPIDHHSDTVLEPEDLRSFRINLKSLVREIAVNSGFTAEPTQVMPGVWYLGVAPAKRGLFLAFTRNNILAPGLISSLRTTGEKLPITIVAPALPAGDLLRFAEAGIHYASTADAFSPAGTAFAIDAEKLVPPSSIAARLTLIREQSKIVLDGRELTLPPIGFKIMWLLAETAIRDNGRVSSQQIEKHLWASTVLRTAVGDAIRNLRKALDGNNMRGKHGDPLVQTLTTQGYFLNLEAADIRLVN